MLEEFKNIADTLLGVNYIMQTLKHIDGDDMFKGKEMAQNGWWVPAGVKIENGCFVATRGSNRRTNPLDSFVEFRSSRQNSIVPPYVTLARSLEACSVYGQLVDENGELLEDLHSEDRLAPIIEWVEANGFLGIMLNEITDVVQGLTWHEVSSNQLQAAWPVDLWTPSIGWSREWILNKEYRIDESKGGEKGAFVEEEPDRAGVSFRHKAWQDITEVASKSLKGFLGEEKINSIGYMEEFFPSDHKDITGEEPFPAPLSDHFINIYREPVAMFLADAITLSRAIIGALNAADPEEVRKHIRVLRALSAPAQLIPNIEGDTDETLPALTFSAPSLLSGLASWALLDLMKPRKAFLCKECGKLHSSAATKSLFCSDYCRLKKTQERYREKKRLQKKSRESEKG
jgi:hypothetical protein